MGVLTDYFRTHDSAVAVEVSQHGPLVADSTVTLDGVSARSVDPSVVLGQLIAFIRKVDWTPTLVESRPVFPQGEPPTQHVDEDSPWATGPWTDELPQDIRDTLAGVTPDQIPDLARQWSTIEEWGWPADELADELQPLLRDLVELAQRAQQAGDTLYCWTSL